MSYDLTNKNISDTFQNLLQRTGSGNKLYDLEGNEIGDLTIAGALHAQSYIVSQSTTVATSGSTIFGDTEDDTHQFIGSITASGTISASGYISASKFVGDGSELTGLPAGYTDSDTLAYINSQNVLSGSNIFINHITASGDISSSGVLSGLSLKINGTTAIDNTGTGFRIGDGGGFNHYRGSTNFEGPVTASGNISTSGDFYGEDYFIAGKQVLDYVGFDSDKIRFGNVTQKSMLRGASIELGGTETQHVTASGDISSSGEISAKDGYKIHDTGLLYKEDTNHIRIAQANGGVLPLFEFKATSVMAQQITASDNIKSTKDVIADGNIITTHITASGNISASGTSHTFAGDITMESGHISLTHGDIGSIQFDNTSNLAAVGRSSNTVTFGSGGNWTDIQIGRGATDPKNIQLYGPVTASGDISSSGGISSSRIVAGYDTDSTNYFGRAIVGYIPAAANAWSDAAGFGHVDQIDTSTTRGYALAQKSDGFTYLNGNTSLGLYVKGSNIMVATGSSWGSNKIVRFGSPVLFGANSDLASEDVQAVQVRGNISASGDLYVSRSFVNTISSGSTGDAAPSLTVEGDISASGELFGITTGSIGSVMATTISASGYIYLKDNQHIYAPRDGAGSPPRPIIGSNSGVLELGFTQFDKVDCKTLLEVDGIISSSGNLYAGTPTNYLSASLATGTFKIRSDDAAHTTIELYSQANPNTDAKILFTGTAEKMTYADGVNRGLNGGVYVIASGSTTTAFDNPIIQVSGSVDKNTFNVAGDISASGDLFLGDINTTYISASNQGNIEIQGTGDAGTALLDIEGDVSASNFYGSISASQDVPTVKYGDGTSFLGATGNYSGEVIYHPNTTSLTKGAIYYLNNTAWAATDADAVGTSTGLLAVALGTQGNHGMLLRGIVQLETDPGGNPGAALYLSATAGQATNSAPGSGDVVRVIGYNVGTSGEIYFNPDSAWVEVA